MSYKYVFWDFNGTIIDDIDLCVDILNEMLITHDEVKKTRKEYLDIFSFPVYDYYDKVFNLKKHSFDDLAVIFTNSYHSRRSEYTIHKNFYETINTLREMGVKNILLSATKQDLLIEQTNELNITHLFDKILGSSNIYAKSKIDYGLEYLKSNNINPLECILVGDTLHDKEVSIKLGIKCLLYTKGHNSVSRLSGVLIDDLIEIIKYVKDGFDGKEV
jgi:phosphoglycolate phosphatase